MDKAYTNSAGVRIGSIYGFGRWALDRQRFVMILVSEDLRARGQILRQLIPRRLKFSPYENTPHVNARIVSLAGSRRR